MANVTIEPVLRLLGESLSDSYESARNRFRQFIEEPQWTINDYRAWIAECIAKGNRSEGRIYYNALQDLIVSIGKRLGFEIRYGRYTGSSSEVANDGCWIGKDAFYVLTEVKTSAWPVESVGQLGGYRQDYAHQNGVPLGQVSGLYIIISGEFTALVDQIKGSDHRSVLRIISFEHLLKLWQLKTDLEPIAGPDEAAAKVQKLLLPIESVNVGEFIDVIMEIAALRSASGESEEEEGGRGGGYGARRWRPMGNR